MPAHARAQRRNPELVVITLPTQYCEEASSIILAVPPDKNVRVEVQTLDADGQKKTIAYLLPGERVQCLAEKTDVEGSVLWTTTESKIAS
jgi:hypothetical protein